MSWWDVDGLEEGVDGCVVGFWIFAFCGCLDQIGEICLTGVFGDLKMDQIGIEGNLICLI